MTPITETAAITIRVTPNSCMELKKLVANAVTVRLAGLAGVRAGGRCRCL